VDNTYTWEDAFAVHVATLNTDNFAGRNDWRLPNVKELQSIVNYQVFNPSVSSEFNTSCPGSTVLTGSCTVASTYWSSTTIAFFPDGAWDVDFASGGVGNAVKDIVFHVRAVRGGSP
jgi:hypothetical protein